MRLPPDVSAIRKQCNLFANSVAPDFVLALPYKYVVASVLIAFAQALPAQSEPGQSEIAQSSQAQVVPVHPVAVDTAIEVKVESAVKSEPAPAGAPAKATAADGPLVEPGPGEAQRTQLIMRIFNAKSQGIGIDAYLNAFAMLENSVKTGETEASVLKRVESINSSLSDQLKRSAVLKSQRPAPPVAASGFAAASSGGAGSSGGTSDLIRKLQEKYGGQIPADLKEKYGGQIPDNLKDKIPAGLGGLDPGQLEDLIKKYKK